MMQLREKRGNISRVIPDGMAPRIMERILGDCVECPDCGALTFWTGNNTAAMGKAIVEIDRIRYAVRRAVYQIKKGVPRVKPGLCIITACSDRCLNDEFLKAVTKGGVVKRSIERGALHGVLHREAIKKARRVRGDAKMDMEKAREVRGSTQTPGQLAEKYSVSRQSISNILTGKVWVERSNPFAGLGARA